MRYKTKRQLKRTEKTFLCVSCGEPFSTFGVYAKRCQRCKTSKFSAYQSGYYKSRRTTDEDYREVCSERLRTWRSQNGIKNLLQAAKGRARQKGLEFDLTEADLEVPLLCPVLKKEMVKGTRYAPSLDRKDPSKGYTKENTWVISRKANTMKNDATQEELQEFANWAKTFQHW